MPGINDDSVVKQELHCHNCNRYVQFELDLAINGNHVLNCPNCGHQHYRVVCNGRITGDRWASANGGTYAVQSLGYTIASTSTIGNGLTGYGLGQQTAVANNSQYYAWGMGSITSVGS